MKKRTATVFYDDMEWTAHFWYSPGRPACHTQRNGDPGWPEDPPEVEIDSLVRDGIVLLGFGDESIEEQCIDAAIAQDEGAMVEYYESRDRRCE